MQQRSLRRRQIHRQTESRRRVRRKLFFDQEQRDLAHPPKPVNFTNPLN